MATLAKERLAVTARTETTARTEMLPDRRRAVLIVNTRARSGASAYEEARQLLARRGFTLDASFPVQDPAGIPKLVTDTLAEGHTLVMIGGGDGTIGAAVNVLAGKDATCGLLPLGTANSFARSLDLPLDLDAAVEVLATGRTKEVDLGKINDRYFTTAVAIGLSSEIQRRKPDKIKSLLGRFAYPTIAGLVLPGFRPFTCTLTRDGGERRDFPAALEVRIANAPYEGGIDAAPDASVTSGDLVVHIVTGSSKWRLVKTWGKIVMGLDPEGPGYETFRAKHLHIATDPPQYVNVDGDAALQTPIDVSIARKALRVIVPR
jgi:YegS/Rv2252/BmrU family lipid kinase